MSCRGAVLLALLAFALAAPPAQAQFVDPDAYCVPENTEYDPQDVARPGAPPVELPPGAAMRRITVAGFTTTAIEAGPRDSAEAVVFMHGNPGNALDFVGLLRSVPAGTRVVAFDLLGFGRADKPYDFPFTLEASRPLVDRVVAELGIERMHLVGHDVGSVVAVDWAARHPEKLRSAILLAGGILIGYQDHHFARIWKTPKAGEWSMSGVDREGFVSMIQAHNPRPLPREFIDRNYDAFDRATRCAVLRLYRAMPDISALAREHAAALRPYDRPALVVWGDRDPFLPRYLADSNREGFPRADVRVFANSGHWPFVDEEQRTVELMSAFLRRHVVEQAGARIGLSVLPRRARVGSRTRFTIRTTVGDARQPLTGALVSIAGRRARTDSHGRATLAVTLRRTRTLKAVAWKPTLVPAAQRVHITGRPRPR
ncbi:MAG TPA: alpha/beta hydrolase [Solirubrobacteraceae bacterium]|nr:alpha/beta hydrolase [Solirubrobacteraceae bacterium]